MLAVLAVCATAFAPGGTRFSSIQPHSVAAVRTVDATCSADGNRPQLSFDIKASLNRPHPRTFCGVVAGTMANIPTWALAGSDDYMSASDEEKQSIVLGIIGLIVFLAPITGIQMARGAISSMADPDDDRFRGNTDPEWSITPDAQRKQKRRALQAKLDAEESSKKFPWQR